MFTNPLAPSQKEMPLRLGAHKSIQNKYCNEFDIIFNVYFKSPAPTALGPLGASPTSFENLFQFHARSDSGHSFNCWEAADSELFRSIQCQMLVGRGGRF